MDTKRHVIVITGAAGTGKTTVSEYLKREYGIPNVITHTTRFPRNQEENGVSYYFETLDSFQKLHLIESVKYSGNLYGSSYEGLERAFAKSSIVSIVLDTEGAISYKNKLGDEADVIFMEVDAPGKLRERMLQRGDSLGAVNRRMDSKEDERDLELPPKLMGMATVIDNESWSKTKQKVDQIVKILEK